jgi:hypothetical protein
MYCVGHSGWPAPFFSSPRKEKAALIKMIHHQEQQGNKAGGKHPESLLLVVGCRDGKAKNLPYPDPFLPLDSCLPFF